MALLPLFLVNDRTDMLSLQSCMNMFGMVESIICSSLRHLARWSRVRIGRSMIRSSRSNSRSSRADILSKNLSLSFSSPWTFFGSRSKSPFSSFRQIRERAPMFCEVEWSLSQPGVQNSHRAEFHRLLASSRVGRTWSAVPDCLRDRS